MLQIKRAMLALSMLIAFSVSAMEIEKHSLSMPQSLQNVSVFHETDRTFTIEDNLGAHTLQPHQLPAQLRNIPKETLSKMLATGAYLKVDRSLDGSRYSVDLQQRIKGGGILLCKFGSWLGVVGTNIIGHGILIGIASLSGPVAGPAVYAGLAASYGPAIGATSKAVGIGLGIAGAAVGGPAL